MKSVAILVLRHLLIPAGFLWAVGFFNLIHYISSIKESDVTLTFSTEEMSTLEISSSNLGEYGDSLYKERNKSINKTGFYEPYLYFRDLKQFSMFESKYRKTKKENPNFNHLWLTLSMQQQSIVGLRDNNWRNIDWDNLSNYPRAQEKRMTIGEARNFWFPEFAIKEAESRQNQSKNLSEAGHAITSWLLKLYLKGLPIAFILFLIWRIRLRTEIDDQYWEKEERKPQFESGFTPLSFLISLIIWPILVYKNIKDNLNNDLRKTEILSRRKNMLSLLSKQDKELYVLSKEMSLKEFRVHLDTLGIKRKHSFKVALLVVFFFVFAVKIEAGVKLNLDGKYLITNIVVDNDVGYIYSFTYFIESLATLSNTSSIGKITKTKSIFSLLKIKVVNGFTRLIDGIPKVSNQFIFFEIDFLT